MTQREVQRRVVGDDHQVDTPVANPLAQMLDGARIIVAAGLTQGVQVMDKDLRRRVAAAQHLQGSRSPGRPSRQSPSGRN